MSWDWQKFNYPGGTGVEVTETCETRKNCFRYLKLMSPLNAAICTTISYTNIFVFRDRSMIFCMWVHDHKAVCCVPLWPSCDLDLWHRGLKQYVSLRSKGRHNNTSKIGLHLIITLHVSIYINNFFYNNAIKHFFLQKLYLSTNINKVSHSCHSV
jgi:hypothetical protein